MANGRNKLRRGDAGRDAGGFVALPWTVLDSPAYSGLSHPAKALLLEFARQFVRDKKQDLINKIKHVWCLETSPEVCKKPVPGALGQRWPY